jgi:hypothetical protein
LNIHYNIESRVFTLPPFLAEKEPPHMPPQKRQHIGLSNQAPSARIQCTTGCGVGVASAPNTWTTNGDKSNLQPQDA